MLRYKADPSALKKRNHHITDILSCNGRHIWMRSQKITFEGKRLEIGLKSVTEQNPEDFHIFCQNGFLDDSWFFRSYWTFGRRVTGGYGAWLKAGRLVPSGRILCFDDRRVYGYGRRPQYMVNSSVVEYQFFAADKVVTRESIARIAKAERQMNTRSVYKNAGSSDWLLRHFFPAKDLTAVNQQWTLDQPTVFARAMAATGDMLFIAGPPDLLDERRTFHNPDDPEVQAALKRQAEALHDRSGGQLWALAKTDGKVVARYALDAIPVFDGMAVAAGSLYIATADGRVIRLGPTDRATLPTIDDQPVNIIWDEPEDPGYLLPPVVRKEGDFAKVARCRVTASKLGYRLRATGKKKVGIAVKKLDRPITGLATFKTHMKAVSGGSGLLSNGYLAFGDGAADAALIKCGARLRTPRAAIVQGPLLKGASKSAKISAPNDKGVQIEVRVDLRAQKIVYTANGETIEAPIRRPLKSITHVGYVMDAAIIDFSPVEIDTP